MSLSGDDGSALRGYWDRLSEGAATSQPLEAAPWGDVFGLLNDKFGVSWLFNIAESTIHECVELTLSGGADRDTSGGGATRTRR